MQVSLVYHLFDFRPFGGVVSNCEEGSGGRGMCPGDLRGLSFWLSLSWSLLYAFFKLL